jgi:hypothetical protein
VALDAHVRDYPAPTWTVTYYFENQAKQFSRRRLRLAPIRRCRSQQRRRPTIRRAVIAGSRARRGLIIGDDRRRDRLARGHAGSCYAGTRDLRSFARRALDAIEATHRRPRDVGQLSFAIRDRTVQSFTLEELMKLRDADAQEVRSEEAAAPGSGKGNIKVRLSRGCFWKPLGKRGCRNWRFPSAKNAQIRTGVGFRHLSAPCTQRRATRLTAGLAT